jgi:hypothetical protein
MPLSRHFSQHASQVSIVGIQSEITDRTIPETMSDPQAIAQMKLAFKIVDEAVGAAESVEMIDGRAAQVAGKGLKRTAGFISKGSKKSPAQRAPKRTGSSKAHANATHELKNFISEDQQQHFLSCFADQQLCTQRNLQHSSEGLTTTVKATDLPGFTAASGQHLNSDLPELSLSV